MASRSMSLEPISVSARGHRLGNGEHEPVQPIAKIVPGRKSPVEPLGPMDPVRKKIWAQVTAAFDGTDHLHKVDSALVQSYVDAVHNYIRLRMKVEVMQDEPLSPNAMRQLFGTLDAQARLVAMLGRELGFGPMARNRLGGFIPKGDEMGIESFTTAKPGRRAR